MKRTRNRWLKRLLAVSLSVSVTLVIAEVALRWQRGRRTEFWRASAVIHRRSEDPVLVYEFVPNSSATRERVSIAINSDGFRDDEFPPEIPRGARRIVVLGDSVAWGWAVEMDQAFPQLLERRLRAAGNDSTVVYNLAVDGYSTEQEIRLLETRGLGLEPDLVIVSYILNDPDNRDGGLSRYFLETRFEVLELARLAWRRLQAVFVATPRVADSPGPKAGSSTEYHQRIHAQYAEQTRAQFRRLGRFGRTENVPILVVVSPVFEFEAGQPYELQNLHDNIAELCRENGLEFLDLQRFLGDRDSKDLARDMWHPNVQGHAAIADILASHLTSRSWPKGSSGR